MVASGTPFLSLKLVEIRRPLLTTAPILVPVEEQLLYYYSINNNYDTSIYIAIIIIITSTTCKTATLLYTVQSRGIDIINNNISHIIYIGEK